MEISFCCPTVKAVEAAFQTLGCGIIGRCPRGAYMGALTEWASIGVMTLWHRRGVTLIMPP